MKKRFAKRLFCVCLLCLFLLPVMPVQGAQEEVFRCEKTAQVQPDGTAQITLRAFQPGRVAATDVVLVLDVSGSMEHNSVVPPDALDGAKTYYMIYEHKVVIDGTTYTKRDYVPVRNTAPDGEAPTWYATMPDETEPTQIDPQTTTFYTGAMENLRAAAAQFAQSLSDNAAAYDAEHRVAVVEFSSPNRKNDSSICTHDNPAHTAYYANILTGDGTPDGALLSVRSHADALRDVFSALQADGATYSDDAMTQAGRIIASSAAQNRVVILFTDGGPGSYGWEGDAYDHSALPTANGAIAAAREMKAQGVQIYTIGAFNEENLSGEIKEKNQTYLNLVSSNYPQAAAMDDAGEKAADGYCSIGGTGMNLQSIFAQISAVIGTPVHSARVQDTVSSYFTMTDAQKDALRAQYPDVRISDNADGTTQIALDDVDFPTVAVRADGSPVDPQDSGIFTMTFSVAPAAEFPGGRTVPTNTGVCGVFAGSVQLAQFEVLQVTVPVRDSVLDGLLSVRGGVQLYAGETLRAEDLYTDLSGSRAASFTDGVTYTVTDAQGAAFTSGMPASSQTFTVTAHIQIDGTTYTRTAEVPVTVRANPVTALEIVSAPSKRNYFEGDTLSTEGMTLRLRYQSGKTEMLPVQQAQITPSVLNKAGTQTVTVRYANVQAQFTVTVEKNSVTALEIVSLPTKREYYVGDTLSADGMILTARKRDGNTFTPGEADLTITPAVMTKPGTQTVTVRCGDAVQTFTVTVRAVQAVSARVVETPEHTTFVYRRTPDFSGLAVEITYNNGTKRIERDLSQMTIRPQADARVRRGERQYTVTVQGVRADFTMRVRLAWWQWIILILLFGWIWY